MEEKNKIKISLSTLFLFIALIVIIIMGIVIVRLYDNKKNSDNLLKELNNKISNLENTNVPDNNINTENETLDINNTLVKLLYGYVLKSDDSKFSFAWQTDQEPASFYKDTKTTYSSLSNIEKMLIVLKNYKESEVKEVFKTQVNDIIDTTYIHDIVKVYENIDEKAVDIFNQSNNNWEDHYKGCSADLNYKNNNYYLSEYDGGGKGTSICTYSEIQKVEKDQDYIYIYDKFIYVDSSKLDVNEGDSKIHIYTSSNETNDIGSESSYPTSTKELYKKYEDKLETYKHTFKKAENGSYYWLSSEIYK